MKNALSTLYFEVRDMIVKKLSVTLTDCILIKGLISNPAVWRDRFVLNSKYLLFLFYFT